MRDRYHREEDKPFGMKQYFYWLGVLPRGISPTDVDGAIHNRIDDSWLFFEFKPSDDVLRRLGRRIEGIKAGQAEALRSLSRRERCAVWLIYDPWADKKLDEECADAEQEFVYAWTKVKIRQYVHGIPREPIVCSIIQINSAIVRWLEGGELTLGESS